MKKKNILVIILAVFYYYIFAYIMHIDTLCIFKATTGIPCPGCGTTRATLALLKGDFLSALWYHPLVIVTWFLILILFIREKTKLTRKLYNNARFWNGILVLYMGLYVYRMIIFFPNRAPLDFLANPLIIRIINNLLS